MHHRPTERADLKRFLLSGDSVLMLAPRRVGKTWLMNQVARDLCDDGHTCIVFDPEGCQTEESFLRKLCAEIEKNKPLTEIIRAHLTHKWRLFKSGSTPEKLSQFLGLVNHRDFLECLVESLGEKECRSVIMVDEFSLFVVDLANKDVDTARSFIFYLRGLQQKYPSVSWFLTGSVGLDTVTRRLGLDDAFMDLRNIGLEPFTRDEARSYVAHIADQESVPRPLQFDDATFHYFAQELGWLSPYYINEICERLCANEGDGRCPVVVTKEKIDAAFDALLASGARNRFASWTRHIDKNFSDDDTARLSLILDRCCQAPDGETEDTLLSVLGRQFQGTNRRTLKDLLGCLDNDGFVIKDGARWRFRSGLLRRYWLEYMSA